MQGAAGAGKTTTLRVIREGAELGGYAVEGFAPTSRAARQLREANISADTLQGFLARGSNFQTAGDPDRKHLYILDESSLASTKQMRDFMEKIGPLDRVLLVGDIRQHQGVDAGKPFEQLQQAGMPTVQLDQIVRQKDPELLKAVECLSKNETAAAIALLDQQGRILEITDPQMRYSAIAKSYAANPHGTLIVSPDNVSRLDINQAVRAELQSVGTVDHIEHTIRVLTPRSDMTGADRAWAAHYNVQDIIYYQRGSRELGIEPKTYAQVIAVHPKENLLTVERQTGEQVTYDPSRLRGINAYREIERAFAVGDRLQFTAPNKHLQVANRDLGIIEHIGSDGRVTVRMDNDKRVSFSPSEMRHLDHGYAVTSHSAQGLTADRVLINVDTSIHPELINARFAYVAVSRGSEDVRLFTNDAASMTRMLSQDSGKSSALELRQPSADRMQKQILPTPEMALSL
ncbi:MAG: ATP-dependent DNA helicase [Terriglobia bacterium]